MKYTAVLPEAPTISHSLMSTCRTGDLSALEARLSAELLCHPDQDAVLHLLLAEATKHQHTAIVEYLLSQTTNFNFSMDLIYPALSSVNLYKLYYARNRDISKYDWQGLGDAVCVSVVTYNIELLTYLLETVGADPGTSLELSPRCCYIFLPLEYAANSALVVAARLLLTHGAVIDGTNALPLAAADGRNRRGRLEFVKLLVEAGANVNGMLEPYNPKSPSSRTVGDPMGTALHCAAEDGLADVVSYLLDHGADPAKVSHLGDTALERAQRRGHHKIISLIKLRTSDSTYAELDQVKAPMMTSQTLS